MMLHLHLQVNFFSSSSSHDSNEEINQNLQAENAELRRLIQEAEVAASITSHRRSLVKVEVQ